MSTDFATIPKDISEVLAKVRRPSRYLGLEVNRAAKSWDQAGFRAVFAFPDLYEIGMSHQGLQILYRIINNHAGFLADRVYAPDRDMEAVLRADRIPLFGLEQRRPLSSYDLIGITLPYELCFTNILTILDLGGIHLYADQRRDTEPLVLGGGSASGNPEPVAPFFDAILIGDGEEAIVEIASHVATMRREGVARRQIVSSLQEIAGVYVPSLYQPVTAPDGSLKKVIALDGAPARVVRRVLPQLPAANDNDLPLMPLGRIVHDRLGLEIARGCTRGCRFCQAGISYRPVRERSCDDLFKMAADRIAATGFEELALLSLSTGDFSCLPHLLSRLMEGMEKQRVSVSLPSMRVGTLTPDIMQRILKVKKTGFTLAPEAGSERLRQMINKGITEPDLLAACRSAFSLGWRLLKLYFMFGLPMETDDDIDAIVDLAKRCLDQAGSARKGARLNVSAATFVPKPHTPFQWARQLSVAQGFAHIDRLKRGLKGMRAQLKWHDPRQSYLEGVFSRGDRRLASVIHRAWSMGARLDAWSEHFRLDLWRQAADKEGVVLDRYLEARDRDATLPWDHIDMGVDRSFLLDELEKATTGLPTPDCRYHGCQKCGLCDFQKIKPIVGTKLPAEPVRSLRQAEEKTVRETFSCRLHYKREGDIRFVGHLEIIQLVYRALRRAGLPLHFSKGFSPIPKVSFSPALSVGMESRAEWFDVSLTAPPGDEATIRHALNTGLPQGLEVVAVEPFPAPPPRTCVTDYTITFPPGSFSRKRFQQQAAAFLQADFCEIVQVRKGKERRVDIRPQVRGLTIGPDNVVALSIVTRQGQKGAKPLEIVAFVFDLPEKDLAASRVVKTGWRGED